MVSIRDTFVDRHIGPDEHEIARMLKDLGAKSLEELITLKADTHCIQFKCVITRPDEYPYNLYTPSLENYSIHIEGQ